MSLKLGFMMNTTDFKTLSDWAKENKEQLRASAQSAERHDLMIRMLQSPTVLAEAWGQIVRKAEASKVPPAVLESARTIVAAVDKASWQFSASEQKALLELDASMQGVNSDDQRVAVLDKAIENGTAPVGLLQKMKDSIVTPGTVGFRWQACGVCGALGLEGGPVVAVGACILCGVLADM